MINSINKLDERVVYHAPAANTVATISTAAPGAKNRQIIKSIIAVLCGDTAGPSGPVQVTLRDGGGAGTILASWFLVAPANGVAVLALADLSIVVPTTANQATLQFEAAGGGTTSRESVSLTYINSDGAFDSIARGTVL